MRRLLFVIYSWIRGLFVDGIRFYPLGRSVLRHAGVVQNVVYVHDSREKKPKASRKAAKQQRILKVVQRIVERSTQKS